MLRPAIGLCVVVASVAFAAIKATPTAPPDRGVWVYTEENMGAGARIFAGFNSQVYTLSESKFYGKAEWNNEGKWYECNPVPAGVAKPACPDPVGEIGMDGIATETLPDGTQLVGVNTQPGVANRHWKVRIVLHLKPRP